MKANNYFKSSISVAITLILFSCAPLPQGDNMILVDVAYYSGKGDNPVDIYINSNGVSSIRTGEVIDVSNKRVSTYFPVDSVDNGDVSVSIVNSAPSPIYTLVGSGGGVSAIAYDFNQGIKTIQIPSTIPNSTSFTFPDFSLPHSSRTYQQVIVDDSGNTFIIYGVTYPVAGISDVVVYDPANSFVVGNYEIYQIHPKALNIPMTKVTNTGTITVITVPDTSSFVVGDFLVADLPSLSPKFLSWEIAGIIDGTTISVFDRNDVFETTTGDYFVNNTLGVVVSISRGVSPIPQTPSYVSEKSYGLLHHSKNTSF